MEKEKQFISLIFTALLGVFLFTISASAKADEPPAMEKCYGVAKAGQNDCDTGPNAGLCTKSVFDSDPNVFIYVPKGLCSRLAGGITSNNIGTIPMGIGVDLHFSGDTSTTQPTSTTPAATPTPTAAPTSTSTETAVTPIHQSNPPANTPGPGLDSSFIFPEPKNTP